MNFLAFPTQPAAGAAGVTSRVQLPAVGHSAFAPLFLSSGKSRAVGSVVGDRDQPRGSLMYQRAQHRAQCRANCMSKANF